MKIISINSKNEKRLIKNAVNKDRAAQKEIFEIHSPKMLSVCRMYIHDYQFSEDVMLKGFFKVFTKLNSYKGEGSFEGWIRRIMIHESINFLKINKKLDFSDNIEEKCGLATEASIEIFETDYLEKLLEDLPNGYKTVFVMSIVEGYKHREIAELLDITEGTSKSQLSKARKMLQLKLINNKENDGFRKL